MVIWTRATYGALWQKKLVLLHSHAAESLMLSTTLWAKSIRGVLINNLFTCTCNYTTHQIKWSAIENMYLLTKIILFNTTGILFSNTIMFPKAVTLCIYIQNLYYTLIIPYLVIDSLHWISQLWREFLSANQTPSPSSRSNHLLR